MKADRLSFKLDSVAACVLVIDADAEFKNGGRSHTALAALMSDEEEVACS